MGDFSILFICLLFIVNIGHYEYFKNTFIKVES